jgi:elongation factor Ts
MSSMSTISAADVNKLRQMTGAGMMDCKKALTESNGDFEAAIDNLRKKGQKISLNRADRAAQEGAVIALTSEDRKTGIVVELNCETDFVAKNEDFVKFAYEIANLALTNKPADADALKALTLGSLTLEQRLLDEMGKTGEKMDVSKYVIINGENVIAYIHAGNRMGVLVEMNNAPSEANTNAGKDTAMQIAAMNPLALNEAQVPAETIAREIEVGKEQAIAEGKPAEMAEKIAQGRLTKFYKEYTLLNQEFVKDSSKSIAKMLADTEAGLTVVSFKRIALGA